MKASTLKNATFKNLGDLSVSKYLCVIASYTKVGGRRIGPCTTIQQVSRSTILSINPIVKKFVGFTLNAKLTLSTYNVLWKRGAPWPFVCPLISKF